MVWTGLKVQTQTHTHTFTQASRGFRSPCQNRLGRASRALGWEPEVRGNPCWQAHRQRNSTHHGVSQIISSISSLTHPEPCVSDQRPVNHHTSIHLAFPCLSFAIYLLALSFKTLNLLFVSQHLLAFTSRAPFFGCAGSMVEADDSIKDLGLAGSGDRWSCFIRNQTSQRRVILLL